MDIYAFYPTNICSQLKDEIVLKKKALKMKSFFFKGFKEKQQSLA